MLLSGCGLDKLPLTPTDAARLASKFGEVTRSDISGNEIEGYTYELTAEARREANWKDAEFALRMRLQNECPDGRSGSTISSSPTANNATDRMAMHPAGTVFRRVVTCPPPPHFEFILEDGLERQEINDVFYERLNTGNVGFPRDPYVHPIRFSASRPKYEAVRKALGDFAFFMLEKCKQGVSFEKFAVGVLPDRSPTGAGGTRSADAYVGYVFSCMPEAD